MGMRGDDDGIDECSRRKGREGLSGVHVRGVQRKQARGHRPAVLEDSSGKMAHVP